MGDFPTHPQGKARDGTDGRGRDAGYPAPPGRGRGYPTPSPTDRSMRISRTTLFRAWFTT